MFNRQCKDSILKDELNALNSYIKVQQAQQEFSAAQEEMLASLRHDTKNIFIGLSALIEQKEYDKAYSIVKNRANILNQDFLISTPDKIVNAILNTKATYAKAYNLTFDYNIFISDVVKIQYDDLSVSLGNAIDNDIDYLSLHKDINRQIHVDISYDFGLFNMSISNCVSESINIPNNFQIPTTKSEPGHGHGLNNIKKIVNKYNGVINLQCIDNVFTLSFTLIS